MKVLVVDDEAPARRRLLDLLEELPGIEVVGEASDGLEALAAIERTHPDLVLLDIEMPELDGLSLAARYAELPAIIFVTAYSEHAVKAFDVHAVDYLLKPVRQERLVEALGRVRSNGKRGPTFLGTLHRPAANEIPRVVVQERGAIRLFDARAINRFYASEKYTAFVCDGQEQLTQEPLLELEERLRPHGFMRVHRGELVRVSAIRSLRSEGGCHELDLVDGQTARVSRRLMSALKKELGL